MKISVILEENPVETNSGDGWLTICPVHTSAEITTDSNSHQAKPVSGNTDRAENNLSNK